MSDEETLKRELAGVTAEVRTLRERVKGLEQSLGECGALNTRLEKENERLKKKLEECEAGHA
jgi:hypothetical protein